MVMDQVRMDVTLSPGKQGERIISDLFTGYGYKVIDVSNEASIQKQGYDFLLVDPNHRYRDTRLEVKTDGRMRGTGNLFAEMGITRPNGYVQPGWMLTSKTDLLAYIDAGCGLAYFFRFEELKQYIERHRSEFRYMDNPNPYDPGSTCGGLLVPLWRVLKEADSSYMGYRIVDIARGIKYPARLPGA